MDSNSNSASGEWIPFSSQSDATVVSPQSSPTIDIASNSIISINKCNFKIIKKLGYGSFGDLYIGEEEANMRRVAIKVESILEKCHQLPNEFQMYKALGCIEGRNDFPKIYLFGEWNQFNVLVMELLGRNLEDIFELCKQNFSLKTILYIALQLIDRFEYIHFKKICYRDVKPENFLLGCPGKEHQNTIYVVDFGLSRGFIDATGGHIPYRDGKNLTGTARYMSINSHHGVEQSRRDDLESIAHVLIYFIRKGNLPWSGLKADNIRERYRLIGQKKQEISIDQLCAGHPTEFADFLKYARQMPFEAEPDYPLVRSWLNNLFVKNNFREDGHYDWSSLI